MYIMPLSPGLKFHQSRQLVLSGPLWEPVAADTYGSKRYSILTCLVGNRLPSEQQAPRDNLNLSACDSDSRHRRCTREHFSTSNLFLISMLTTLSKRIEECILTDYMLCVHLEDCGNRGWMHHQAHQVNKSVGSPGLLALKAELLWHNSKPP